MQWSKSSSGSQQPHRGQGMVLKGGVGCVGVRLSKSHACAETSIAYGEGDGKFLPLNGALMWTKEH